jgi:hypothetical protein
MQIVRIVRIEHPQGIRGGWHIPYQYRQSQSEYVDFAFQKLLSLSNVLEEADHPDNYLKRPEEPDWPDGAWGEW